LVGRTQWNVSDIAYLSVIPTFSVGLIYINVGPAGQRGGPFPRWQRAQPGGAPVGTRRQSQTGLRGVSSQS